MDEAIIEKAKKGNERAFRLIVEKYRTTIFHAVYAILRNQKDAEDAVQEVFIKLHLSLPQYKQQGFKTWMTRIAVNHAIDMRRKAYRIREQAVEDIQQSVDPLLFSVQRKGIEAKLVNKELYTLIHQRLNELPENHREVIYGFYIAEKTYEQLAEELDVKVDTIGTKLYRARLWMQKHWKESDFS